MSRAHLAIVVVVAVAIALVYHSRTPTRATQATAARANGATRVEATAVRDANHAGSTDRASSPTRAEADPRKRSLAAIRGAVTKAVRPCARSISGPPLRVFVSTTVTVERGTIRASATKVETSAPGPEELAACIARELGATTIPAPDGDAGTYPVHVSMLAP